MRTLQQNRKKLLPKLYKLLEDIFYNGRLHGLTIAEAHCLKEVYNNLVLHNTAKFIQSNIAKLLKKQGVYITMDHNKVNYIADLTGR